MRSADAKSSRFTRSICGASSLNQASIAAKIDMNECPNLGSGHKVLNDRFWVIRAAFGYPLRSTPALVYVCPLLYPSMCNSLIGGLRGDAKSMT